MSDDRTPPLERALASAARLREGTWESVEALALLAIQAAVPTPWPCSTVLSTPPHT